MAKPKSNRPSQLPANFPWKQGYKLNTNSNDAIDTALESYFTSEGSPPDNIEANALVVGKSLWYDLDNDVVKVFQGGSTWVTSPTSPKIVIKDNGDYVGYNTLSSDSEDSSLNESIERYRASHSSSFEQLVAEINDPPKE